MQTVQNLCKERFKEFKGLLRLYLRFNAFHIVSVGYQRDSWDLRGSSEA